MKKLLILMLVAAAQLASGKTVSVQVIDDLGQPVADADVSVWFWSFVAKPQDEKKYKTDADGRVTAQGETLVGYDITVTKQGYYTARSEPYIPAKDLIERTYILPRVLRPIGLKAIRDTNLKLPAKNVWLGFDFEANDWLSPYGKGKTADFNLRYQNEFSGWQLSEEKMASARKANSDKTEDEIRFFYGKWDGVLEVSFLGEKEGVYEEEKRFLPYSELKLPHLAPESGYEPTRRYEASTYKGRPPARQVGLFLRTRVKLDADGKVIAANYAKIYGDIYFDARGEVKFGYYYNPTPNDRNLEFDRSRNLLKLPSIQENPSYP
jgi:hypothetical protein